MSKNSPPLNSLLFDDSSQKEMPLFILIDGHSLAYRSYYALSKSRKGPLVTKTGIPTSICFGFLNSLLQIIESNQAKSVAIAFDIREATFRHEAYSEYKANREETPEDFIVDVNNLQQLLRALNFSIVTAAGYEADDVIATLAEKASLAGYQVKIVSGDRDLFQLVDETKNISVIYLDRNLGNYSEFDAAAVERQLGVKPKQVVDYKALSGDKSDNIPGVKGIGEKTAVKLIQEYNSLEAIYQNIEKITGSIKQKLQVGQQQAEMSQKLAQIVTDVPITIDLEKCRLQGFDVNAIKPLLEKLELKKFIQKIEQLYQQLGGSKEISSLGDEDKQLSLFNIGEITEELAEKIAIAPRIITTSSQLAELITILKTCNNPNNLVAWDTETTALEARDAELVGIGCCWGINVDQIAYIPTGHTSNDHLDKQEVLSALRPILESADYPKVLQNSKFDRLILWHQGIKLAGVVFDTMLASYVLYPEQSHKLEDLSRQYLSGIVSQNYKSLDIPKGKTIADLDINTVAVYCGMDAYATLLLVPHLQDALFKVPELEKLLIEVEQPLEIVLAKMEYQGVRINSDYLHQLSQQLEENLQAIEKQAYQEAGEEFNLASPNQLSVLLFDKLGLDKRKSRKIKTGYSTDHATLEKLQGDHRVIDTILQNRTLAKLKSTYVDALPALVRKDTNRLHTNFNQTITSTGRLSSSNPNLQNIPIRTEFSRKIRQAFIPEEGWLLVSADYSQIELRILAHLSQEPVLLEAYRSNQDVHTVTAKLLLEKDEITSEERRLGKIINFGVIYGMGAQKFAREAGVTSEVGRKFINKYRERYSLVFGYLEERKQQAIAEGFVSTILGRRRYFEFTTEKLQKLRGANLDDIDLNKLNITNIDAQLLRAAANAPIQGSSADIIKVAMVKLDSVLEKYQARLLLQVHDELVFEVPVDEWEELQNEIKSTMETAVTLSIPLVVDIHAGKNWMEAK